MLSKGILCQEVLQSLTEQPFRSDNIDFELVQLKEPQGVRYGWSRNDVLQWIFGDQIEWVSSEIVAELLSVKYDYEVVMLDRRVIQLRPRRDLLR